ncbi:MAG: hydrogenase formation protein HypD [Chloroflexi bacterium]|nr:hydrogenase formation protein HypD [Chloroflexota bacterium]MCL5026716.1 hydrogenase formation protein HypD [Chloroflexota bacterium]
MRFIDEYRDSELARGLVEHIHRRSKRSLRLMEFCGGHTVTIFRYGLRQLLPPTLQMLSGPGCPVCVTANADLDKIIALARTPGVILATFGDLLKVPGSTSSLQQARAEGGDVRIVYSTLDALLLARENPDRAVVFAGIGFETTAPTVAASVLQAKKEGIDNYKVISVHKTTPPVLRALVGSGEVRVDGLICPGHVSAIIGSRPYAFLPREYGIGCAVAGFEPVDILQAVAMLVDQLEAGEPRVDIAYRRGVRPEGNTIALGMIEEVFAPGPADWRGIGVIPDSGLRLRDERFDAERAFAIEPGPTREPAGCICGDILRAVKTPLDCRLFRRVCTPEYPVGPCMVSSEGTCATYYHYGQDGPEAEEPCGQPARGAADE